MYSKRHNLIIGFHGCDIKVRDNIVNLSEDQQISNNEWDWLGHSQCSKTVIFKSCYFS
jgi:hypothetical protein